MGKSKGGFGAKIANRQKEGKKCSICGSAITMIKIFKPIENENSLRYQSKFIKVCNCNKNDL